MRYRYYFRRYRRYGSRQPQRKINLIVNVRTGFTRRFRNKFYRRRNYTQAGYSQRYRFRNRPYQMNNQAKPQSKPTHTATIQTAKPKQTGEKKA